MTLAGILDSAVGRGKQRQTVSAEIVRTLTPEDLLELAQPDQTGQGQPVLRELRNSHHEVARLLAKGERPTRVASITGYSVVRISILRADPTFAELEAYYKEISDKEFKDAQADVAQRLRAISVDTMEVIHERLLEQPDSISMKDLTALAELGLDRIGHGKQSQVNTTHVHSIDEAQLDRIRSAKDAPANLAEEDREGLVRLALLATDEHSPAEEREGSEAGRAGIREEGGEGDQEQVSRVIDLSPVAGVSGRYE